ncbi:MAG TPA: hypothetical protein VLM89_02200 [Phycisphaerae bacterium]|nr:hypothetical protein [Phycisphaerae bacterium]
MVRLSMASLETWAAIRRRMLRETEAFLDDALRHPERQIVIPAVRIGEAEFTRGYAHLFWAQILGSS